MDKQTVRAEIRKTQAHNEDEIEKMRPLHPGKTDEELAASIWYDESMYNLDGRHATDRYNLEQKYRDAPQDAARHLADLEVELAHRMVDLNSAYSDFIYDIQREKAEAEVDRKKE